MKTEVWISYNYGYSSLQFSKTFELPFTPFYGMWLTDGDNQIEFTNSNYTQIIINYNMDEGFFEINRRESWRHPVSDETIDDILEIYKDWERQDSTNVSEMKAFMKTQHDRLRQEQPH